MGIAALVILPIVALFALVALGSTVEQEFVPIEQGSGVASGNDFDAPETSFEEPDAPFEFNDVVTDDGAALLSVPETWDGPTVGMVNGTQVSTWRLSEFDDDGIEASVQVFTRDFDESLNLEGVLRFEAAELGLDIDLIQNSTADTGRPVGATLIGPDGRVGGYLVVHKVGDGYAVSVATMSVYHVGSYVLLYHEQIDSVTYLG